MCTTLSYIVFSINAFFTGHILFASSKTVLIFYKHISVSQIITLFTLFYLSVYLPICLSIYLSVSVCMCSIHLWKFCLRLYRHIWIVWLINFQSIQDSCFCQTKYITNLKLQKGNTFFKNIFHNVKYSKTVTQFRAKTSVKLWTTLCLQERRYSTH